MRKRQGQILLGFIGHDSKSNGKKKQKSLEKGNDRIRKHFGCYVENDLGEKVDEGRQEATVTVQVAGWEVMVGSEQKVDKWWRRVGEFQIQQVG